MYSIDFKLIYLFLLLFIFFDQTPSNKKIEMSTIGSAYHLEVNPR